MNGWHNMKTDPPLAGQWILVAHDEIGVCIAKQDEDGDWYDDGIDGGVPLAPEALSHWQDLPDLPTEGEG